MVYTFDENNFEAEVLKSDIPVFVDFYADWCGPCKMMGPVISKLADAYEGKVKVGKINVDDNPEIAEQFNVMSIPNMVFFKNGQAVDRQIGASPQAALAKKFDAVLS
ncbi:MAG TPA: thioredoxin [Lachnospiraceae bacterium]|jgi:thioredoxin 1|nr:thioredoxin [Lachnospiraceae bacterium]